MLSLSGSLYLGTAGLYLGHENPQVLMLGSEAVRYLAFSLPLYVFIFGIVNYIQGIKKIFTANVFVLFIQLVIPVSIIYVTVKVLGAGAWLSTPYSALILTLLCAGYVVSQKIPSKVPVEFKKRLLLAPDFYDNDGHELDLAADSGLKLSACRESRGSSVWKIISVNELLCVFRSALRSLG